jgi:anti-anti-sigma factor
MPDGQVTHAERAGVHVLRYFGRVNFMLAPGIQRFMDHLLEKSKVSGVVFDLTLADSLDSTNFGLMARVNERLRELGAPNSVIVSGNEDIDAVLRSMGFDQSFELLTGSRESLLMDSLAPIEGLSPAEEELRRTMLEAHRALVRLSDAGRLAFEPVVACLERAGTGLQS